LNVFPASFICPIEAVYVFPPQFRQADFTFIIIDLGDLIFSGQTFEVTVCGNAQLIFPLCL